MPKLKEKDKATSENRATSEGALKLLGLLPDSYDAMSKDDKRLARESRTRYLKSLTDAGHLNRFKVTGKGFCYYKTQLKRVYEEFLESGKSLIIG